jgi:hypothetical protein
MAKVKLVAESLQDWKGAKNGQINEGALDFFKGARALVKQAMKDPKNEEYVDKALKAGFAKQFGNYPKIKEAIISWDLEKKQELVKRAAKVLEDPKIGILTLRKNAEGKLEVLGSQVAGGAGHSTTGA